MQPLQMMSQTSGPRMPCVDESSGTELTSWKPPTLTPVRLRIFAGIVGGLGHLRFRSPY